MNQAFNIHSNDADTLGGRIAHARDMAGKSIDEASAQVGVTADTFSEWENDRSEPRSNKLTTLAGILGVTPIWLISGAGDGPDATITQVSLSEMRNELDRLRLLSGEVIDGIDAVQDRIEVLLHSAK